MEGKFTKLTMKAWPRWLLLSLLSHSHHLVSGFHSGLGQLVLITFAKVRWLLRH